MIFISWNLYVLYYKWIHGYCFSLISELLLPKLRFADREGSVPQCEASGGAVWQSAALR